MVLPKPPRKNSPKIHRDLIRTPQNTSEVSQHAERTRPDKDEAIRQSGEEFARKRLAEKDGEIEWLKKRLAEMQAQLDSSKNEVEGLGRLNFARPEVGMMTISTRANLCIYRAYSSYIHLAIGKLSWTSCE